jgi:hypothetical protein
VAALLLKGPTIARVLYEPGEERMYSDVDILVEPAALERARAVLRGREGVCVHENLGVEDVGGGLHSEDWLLGHVVVDLHWRLPATDAPSEVIWKALYGPHQLIDLKGRRVHALSRAGLALHIAIHAAWHKGQHRPGIRDLELALERWPPEVWDDASGLAREIGASEAFAAGLQLAPAGRALARASTIVDVSQLNWTPVDEWPRGTYHLRAFAKAGSLTGRARLVRRALLPSSRWILREYPWARRWGPLQIAAYTIHLGRAPLWALRALRFHRLHARRRVNKGR